MVNFVVSAISQDLKCEDSVRYCNGGRLPDEFELSVEIHGVCYLPSSLCPVSSIAFAIPIYKMRKIVTCKARHSLVAVGQ